ncbi:MAG: hypothetical protein ACR2M3_12120 [Thermomicrobiales bacterium]
MRTYGHALVVRILTRNLVPGTLLVVSPLLGLFFIFQRQFMSSCLHSGIR